MKSLDANRLYAGHINNTGFFAISLRYLYKIKKNYHGNIDRAKDN